MRVPCPRYDGPVLATRLKGVPIDVCPRCRAIRLDRGDLERLRARLSGRRLRYTRRPGSDRVRRLARARMGVASGLLLVGIAVQILIEHLA